MKIYFKPLLSIAIPTFNRAGCLEIALSNMLPQINLYNNEIEFIISDNASTDNTSLIINKYKEKYSEINIITFLQSENTGYFGNFKKCRELANGRYLWLLSDNEHIGEGVIAFLINTLKTYSEVGAYFLENVSANENNTGFDSFLITESNIKSILVRENSYLITLISAIIMLNDKSNDEYVKINFNGNSFLGFLYLCNGLIKNSKMNIISGKIYNSIPAKKTFNVFLSFTKDITECCEYMVYNKIIDNNIKNIFYNNILLNIIKKQIYIYRLNPENYINLYRSTLDLKKVLDNYYGENEYYKIYIVPLFYIPSELIKIKQIMSKLYNKMKKILI